MILLIVAFAAAGLAYVTLSEFTPSSVEGKGGQPAPAQPTNINQSDEIDTSDWKTYRNEIIGIEFDYPSDWSEITSEGLKSEDRGDAVWGTFSLDLPDLSHVNHTFIDYDNLSVNEQYEKIKCYEGDVLAVVCEERVNRYGTRYVWLVEETKGDPAYGALVPTGKYVLIFDFQEKENYKKRSEEYQSLLNSLRIVE